MLKGSIHLLGKESKFNFSSRPLNNKKIKNQYSSGLATMSLASVENVICFAVLRSLLLVARRAGGAFEG